MKKAYILLSFVMIISILAALVSLNLSLNTHLTQDLTHTKSYIQAQILAKNAKALAALFLEEAKKQGKDCLNYAKFDFLDSSNSVYIDYLYLFATCENFTFKNINSDVNLSKEALIIANISVFLNQNKGVNNEIFVSKKAILKPKPSFFK